MADPSTLSFVNAFGVTLTPSGAYKVLNSSASVVIGTAGADGMRGQSTGQLLQGGLGNDTYILPTAKDAVRENPGAGVDTVRASAGHVLEANIENLTLEGSAAYGKGNAQANILLGNAAAQTLDGAGGADVLVGGGGKDIFVESKGSGRDVITDFAPGVDKVRLDGFSFTSFTAVQAAMTQVGADVSLALGGGDGVIFRNRAIGDFHASDFQLPIDLSTYTLAFDDEFTSGFSVDTGSGGTWRPVYRGGTSRDARHLNDEAQVYTDASWHGVSGQMTPIDPFSVSNGVLNITETKLTSAQSADAWGLQYSSGLVTTRNSFAQEYGYFEVRAKMPNGQGLWPAFWLLPTDGSWPPELDVFEELGKDPTSLFQTLHSGLDAAGHQIKVANTAHVDDLSQGFHTFGVLWTATDIVWYVDGAETARTATPATMHKPMYMLIDLAVGGAWAGGVTDATPSGASLQLDYVRAYSLPDGSAAPTTPPVSSPPPTTPDPPPPPPAAPGDALVANGRVLAATSLTDHIALRLGDLDASATGVQVIVKGFAGAGAWAKANNDWLTLSGFSAGSTLTFDHVSTADPSVDIYTLRDAANGHVFLVGVEAPGHAHLAKGDYGFF